MRLLSFISLITMATILSSQSASAETAELYCTIRDASASLNCQWLGKERRVMTPEEIPAFVDQAQIAAYLTVKSRKGLDRTFLVDSKAPQLRRLDDLKRSASISEINKAKNDLFSEIERKIVKLSDQMDGLAASAELVQYDSSLIVEKNRRERLVFATTPAMASPEDFRPGKMTKSIHRIEASYIPSNALSSRFSYGGSSLSTTVTGGSFAFKNTSMTDYGFNYIYMPDSNFEFRAEYLHTTASIDGAGSLTSFGGNTSRTNATSVNMDTLNTYYNHWIPSNSRWADKWGFGLNLNYDLYPTALVTSPTAAKIELNMSSANDYTVGANYHYYKYLGLKTSMRFVFAYNFGLGAGSGDLKSKYNNNYIAELSFPIDFNAYHSIRLGLNYIQRNLSVVQYSTSGTKFSWETTTNSQGLFVNYGYNF